MLKNDIVTTDSVILLNEKGKIDTKAYELAVKEYIRNLETLENSQEEVNSFRH